MKKESFYNSLFMIKEHPIINCVQSFNNGIYLTKLYQQNIFIIHIITLTLVFISISIGLYYRSLLYVLIALSASIIVLALTLRWIQTKKKKLLTSITYQLHKQQLLQDLLIKYEFNSKHKITVLKEYLNTKCIEEKKISFLTTVYNILFISFILWLYNEYSFNNSQISIILLLVSIILLLGNKIILTLLSMRKSDKEYARIMLETIQIMEYNKILKIEG